jgi:hypothetical protein
MARLARGDAEDLARTPPGQIQVEARQRGLAPHLPARIAAAPVRRGQKGYALADDDLGPRRNE